MTKLVSKEPVLHYGRQIRKPEQARGAQKCGHHRRQSEFHYRPFVRKLSQKQKLEQIIQEMNDCRHCHGKINREKNRERRKQECAEAKSGQQSQPGSHKSSGANQEIL
jgi:hypothetical protein